jgi:hypothetical protein
MALYKTQKVSSRSRFLRSLKQRKRTKTAKRHNKHKGGQINRVGIRGASSVAYQPDSYSAPIMTDYETAQRILEDREPYKL